METVLIIEDDPTMLIGLKDNFEFNALAGKLEGDPATLAVEDFWELGPLDRAVAKLGQG